MTEKIQRKRSKPLQKNFQLIKSKNVTKTPGLTDLFTREIKYLKARDIRRAMSKLISEFCKGNIQNEDAKTAVYLFSTYIQILTTTDFEERLKRIELESKSGYD
ncbi:MAG: hypothetical protein IPM32_18235 [Ignavibacteriae bacterium]|nr:hypothetical protein [Ignavibacteriota bacterium]